MKIKLPLRETYSVIAFLIICCFPNFIYAQCGSCGDQTPSETLDGCPSNPGFTMGIFDLSMISGVSSDSIEYYETCSGGSGNLQDEITSNITTYSGADDDVIYIQELDGNGDCDTVYTRKLNVLEISVSIDKLPTNMEFCAGAAGDDGRVRLTAIPSGNNDNPPNYAWNTPTSGTPNSVSINAGTPDAPYSVSMTDVSASGVSCTVESEIVMVIDQSFIISTSSTNPTCAGLDDGTFSITVTGGSGTFDYSLSNGDLDNNEGDEKTFGGLAGSSGGISYTVTVTNHDGISCTISSSETITDPAEMNLTMTGVPPLMSGGNGTINVAVIGGASPYDWERTGSGSPTSDDNKTSPFTIPNVPPGSYSVTVTDDNGCTKVGTATVPMLQCDIAITGSSTVPPACRNSTEGFKGQILLTTEDYDMSYTIVVNGPDDKTVSGQTMDDVTIDDLQDGTYAVTVTDNLGCSATASNIVIVNPPQITFSTSEAMSTCPGVENGVIQISNITNGSGTYTVTWNGPGNNDGSIGPFTDDEIPIPNLATGSYSISLTDSNGCTPPSQSESVAELDEVTVSIVGDDVFCFDENSGTLSTIPSSGFTYLWSTNSTLAEITIPNPGASADTYMVTVTDGAGCTGDAGISVSRLPAISVSLNSSASKTSVTCASDCDGRIQLNVSGGSNTYSYDWDGPMNFSASSRDIDDLCTGDYSVTITDTEGCEATFSQSISTPTGITASASGSEPECNGDTDGAATVDADGGTLPYSYLWTPGNLTSQSISGLSAGTYTVRVTDANNCFVTETLTLTEPDPVVGIIAPNGPSICNGEEISLNVDGGTSFAWSNGLGSNADVTVSPSTTTTYNVIVTDAATNNCTDVASVTVTVNALPDAMIGVSETSGLQNDDRNLCEGDPVTITASGGTMYSWAGGLPNPFTVSPSQGSESYNVTVTDGNGCTDTEIVEITINENPAPSINFGGASQEVADPQNIGSNSIANCGTIVACDWKTNGTPVSGGDCDGISPTFSTQGSKSITLSVLNSCGCTEEITDILEIFASDQCAIEEFTVNSSLGVACVGKALDIEIKDRPGPSCMITETRFDVFENGTLLDASGNYEYTGNEITFLKAGTFDMTYEIKDNCGCIRPSTRRIVVSPAPSVGFMSGNQLSGCEGETVNVRFTGFDSGEKVDVMYSNGNVFTYEVDNFDFQLGANATENLTIVSVKNNICENEITGESIEISVTPKFKIVSQTTKCTDDGLSYTLTIKTSGGTASESIIAEGIVGTASGADNYIIPNLDPTKPYSFTLSRGDVCDAIAVEVPMIVCNCTFFVGENEPVAFSGCEGDVFNISNIFTPSDDFDQETDTLIYVLHNQQTGLSLGKVFAVYPSTTSQISSDFVGFTPNITLRLSVVGVRKATLDDFDFDDPSSLSNAGAGRCLSVVSGIPLVWFRAPLPELGTANNTSFICRNAYDFMVFAKNPQIGSDITFSVDGLPEGSIKNYGFQDTVFIHFVDNGQDSFNITITESKVYNDGTTSFTCEGSTTTTVYVKDGPGSPLVSSIILWPGNILASTADSSTTCFDWGFKNFGQEVNGIGSDKYLYAASDIDFSNTSRIYFVDTYFCDNPDCVTRIFYNDEGPSPGLNYQKEETFSYLVKPNPNQGRFTLDLFSDEVGDFSLKIIDITGKVVLDKKTQINVGQNVEGFDLTNVPKGMYFIQILNTTLNEYSISKIVIN